MIYQVSIAASPKNSGQWFSGQHLVLSDGIRAKNRDEAQEMLDRWCAEAGTDKDPYFIDFGPAALE